MGVIVESLEDSYYPALMSYTPMIGGRYLIATRGERSGGAGQFATVHDLDTHTHQVFTIRAPGGATLDDGGPQTRQWQVYGGAVWQCYLYATNKIGAIAIKPDGSYTSHALTGYTPYWGIGGCVLGGRLLANVWTGSYYKLYSYDVTNPTGAMVDLGQMGASATPVGSGSDGTNFYVTGGGKIRKWTSFTSTSYTDYTITHPIVGDGWWDAPSGVIGWATTDGYLAFLDVSTMTVDYVANPYPQPAGCALTSDSAGVWHWIGHNNVYSYTPSTGTFRTATVAFPVTSNVVAFRYGAFVGAIGS